MSSNEKIITENEFLNDVLEWPLWVHEVDAANKILQSKVAEGLANLIGEQKALVQGEMEAIGEGLKYLLAQDEHKVKFFGGMQTLVQKYKVENLEIGTWLNRLFIKDSPPSISKSIKINSKFFFEFKRAFSKEVREALVELRKVTKPPQTGPFSELGISLKMAPKEGLHAQETVHARANHPAVEADRGRAGQWEAVG